MGNKKHPFHHIVHKVAAAGTNELEHDVVSPGRFYCFQHIGVINETSTYTRLRIIARTGGADHLLTSQQSPTSDRLYWDTETYFLGEGEQLVSELTGCTLSDVLKMYVRGWWMENGKVE